MFLKTQNVSPAAHPVRKELQRVQGYIEKLKAAAAKRKTADATPASPAAPVSDADKAAARTLLRSLDSATARTPRGATGHRLHRCTLTCVYSAVSDQPDVLELPSGGGGGGEEQDKKKKKKKKKRKDKRDRDDQ